ncbi:MAG TPA: DUF192 domain-containing protein [Devosiaceae bacterium]|nr:DUF192 domain-containing protein [Devosiaceae bacterium]
MSIAAPLSRPFSFLAMLRALGICLALIVVGVPLAAASADDSVASFQTKKGDFKFNIEVVDTDAGRERGLMFRRSLAPNAGMLFDFLGEQPVDFWMVNTFIPLDMVFMTANGTVKTVHANARPQDATPIPSGGPVRFVLEIPGGRAAEIGLVPGDKMEQARVTKTP